MWQLTGSGDGPYEIQEDGKRIATITHTDLETARKMAAADRLLEALKGLLGICRGIPHRESLLHNEELAVDHAAEEALIAIAATHGIIRVQ
jgi:hypothetical protein